MQIEIGNDLRIEQADGVGCRGVAEARVKLFRDGSAADDGAPLQHLNFQSGPGEIGSTDEAIVTATDHDDVKELGVSRAAAGG